MSDFNKWHDDVADMPYKDENGEWVDLETGFSFSDYQESLDPKKYLRNPKHKAKTLNARNVAKSFGGVALSGTYKQVKWAECIRADKLAKLNEVDARLCCRKGNILRMARLWIQNREKPASEFVAFIRETDLLREKHTQATEQENTEVLKEAAEAYNELTKKWGIE